MISIPVNGNNGKEATICEHFGHAPFFAFITVDAGSISGIEFIENPYEDHAPGQIPAFLNEHGAKVIIARGMGGRAKDFFAGFGIETVTGAHGNVEEIVRNYLNGELKSREYTPEDKKHHHGDGHNCSH